MEEAAEINPGDRVEVTAKLRFTDLGGSKEPSSLRGNGILLTASATGAPKITTGTDSLRNLPQRTAENLKSILEQCFPEDTGGLAKALLLGDQTDLDDGISLSFQLAGLSHIVAVSGLHMSILFAMVCLMTGRHRFWTAALGIPVVIFFAAMVGFTASVTRAMLMEILMLLALAIDREYDPPTALAFAVLVMLVRCPLVITSVGFQLSVTSVAGIFLFYRPCMGWFRTQFRLEGRTLQIRLVRGIAAALSISLSATVLTTPLVAWYFGTVSLIGPVANLLVVPLVGLIFYGVGLVCLAGAISLPMGTAIAGAVSVMIRYILRAADCLSRIPLAVIYTESRYIVLWLVLCYGLLLWVLIRRPENLVRPLICGILGLGVALSLSWAEPMGDEYRVTVLNVGQGQCILLQSRRNVFMVDCGGDSDAGAGEKAAQELLSMGISQIDGLIITHYDRDHTGGVERLSRQIRVDRLYLPRAVQTGEAQQRILTALPDSERIWLDGDAQIRFGDCRIHIFSPETGKSGNESCAAVLFQNEKYDTLIISDRSAAQERSLLETGLPDLEVLVVGHHGSKTSTCPELLYRTAPEIALISVGENSYGHPAEEVLCRLRQYGCAVWRTDETGDLVFRR
jgi:competence protein ComEC